MISIIPYNPVYQKPVINLILNIQRQEFGISITASDQPDLSEIPEFYQKGSGNFWLALASEEVVGTISLLDIGNKQVALRKMFVKKDYRGSRFMVARTLLAEALTWSKNQGISEIFLGTTPKFLAAHRFYEKNGFDLIPKDTLPENFPIMKVDTRFYRHLV